MVAWSTLYIADESTTSSSDGSLKLTSKLSSTVTVEDALKCYVCDSFFSKPRILPCGHTYCSTCLLRLRENALQEFNKSRDCNAHRRGECGFFTCPWPNCHYSMKIMNVWRWTLRNKAMARAVAIAKKQEMDKQEAVTQTDVRWSDVMLSLPDTISRSLSITDPHQSPQSPAEVAMQVLVQNAVSGIDCVPAQHCRLPGQDNGTEKTWKSYAFMVGMVFVDQVLKIGTSNMEF